MGGDEGVERREDEGGRGVEGEGVGREGRDGREAENDDESEEEVARVGEVGEEESILVKRWSYFFSK